MNRIFHFLLFGFIIFNPASLFSQKATRISYVVSIDAPAKKLHVEMKCEGFTQHDPIFKMPVWTPGYYQRMDYAKYVADFQAFDENGNSLKIERTDSNSWKVHKHSPGTMKVRYSIRSTRPFVASNYVDEERAYILPAGTFVHPAGLLSHSSSVVIKAPEKWNRVVSGLDTVAGLKFTFESPDYDILYDSPFLAGNLEELPSFTVQKIPHRFIGFKLGEFDKLSFVSDLKKIVEESVKIIGHIPYKHYTFIAIGPGAGGIEHLNNTTISFSGSGLKERGSRIRLLHFLAHEYFHHYNVKRIRPIELGPFDYDKGNKTNLLWVSEGLSVYYEYLVVRRAGLSTDEELLNALRLNIRNYEDKPGRLYQTLEQASLETWSDGPFGRTNDEVNKTISYYDKGPAVGMLLDLKIRNATQNKRSLDDVMRFLYNEYYINKKRGFTDEEFREACEKIAGITLGPVFEYVTTTKPLDYNSYLGYAGLVIDTLAKQLPGARLGITTRTRNDSLFVASIEWQSPAWEAGIRQGDVIDEIDDVQKSKLNEALVIKSPGEKLKVTWYHKGEKIKKEIQLDKKMERSFIITPISDPSKLQKEILQSWLTGGITTIH